MTEADVLTAELASKTEALLALVEENRSPIKNSLSGVPLLRNAYTELRNMTRALGQYARTDRSLRYIGLMGTFSSGKSSVINSLLGQDVRKVDLPPVDDEITILAHTDNRGALMSAHSRGLLRVTVQPVDADLLKGCFIVDTPGSGDPEVREGMVKDFLPVCDLILYVFSAANALSVPDLSVLTILQDQLDFVPIRFVITRCDEFRKDRLSPLSDSNLDRERLDNFLGHLIARIRLHAPKLNVSQDNFSFVDNVTEFGVDQLRHNIISSLDSDVHLHAKKIAYFRRVIFEQKKTFETYLSQLICDLDDLDQKAKENKEKYDKNIVLSVQSIYEFWRLREKHHFDRREAFASKANELTELLYAGNPDLGSEWTTHQSILEFVESRSAEFAREIGHQLIEQADRELRHQKLDLQGRLPGILEGDQDEFHLISLPNLRLSVLEKLIPNVQRAIQSTIRMARGALLDIVLKAARDDRTKFETLFDYAKSADLASKDNEYSKEFGANIRLKFREFMPIVAMFKGAVTSTRARNLIARTGLGAGLDVLDDVGVDEAAANDHADRFLQDVFVGRLAKHEALQNAANALAERKDLVEPLLNELNHRIVTELPQSEFIDLPLLDAVSVDAERLLLPIIENSIAELQAETARLEERLKSIITEGRTRFSETVSKDRTLFVQQWYHRLGGVFGVGAFFGTMALIGLVASGLQSAIGWAWTLFTSAVTVLAPAVLRWGWQRVSKAPGRVLPRRRRTIAETVAALMKPELANADIAYSDKLRASVEERAKQGFKAALFEVLAEDRNRLLSKYAELSQSERNIVTDEGSYILTYVESWNALSSAMIEWYRPNELKSQLISEAASAIKQRAIEPALQLFATRLGEVRNFADRMRDISI
jgi:predicted GTPase